MKKLLGIVVLGLLFLNSNNVLSEEKFAEFHCDVIDGSAPNIPFSINLDKGTMKWGWGKEYKISNISSKKIIGLKPDQNDGYLTGSSVWNDLNKYHVNLNQNPEIKWLKEMGDLGGDFVFISEN